MILPSVPAMGRADWSWSKSRIPRRSKGTALRRRSPSSRPRFVGSCV